MCLGTAPLPHRLRITPNPLAEVLSYKKAKAGMSFFFDQSPHTRLTSTNVPVSSIQLYRINYNMSQVCNTLASYPPSTLELTRAMML